MVVGDSIKIFYSSILFNLSIGIEDLMVKDSVHLSESHTLFYFLF